MKSILNVGLNDKDGSQVKLDLGIDRNHALLILGTSGSGKTHLLKKILKEIDQESALFVFGDSPLELTAENTVHVDIDESAFEFADRTVFTVKGLKSKQATLEILSKVFTQINSMHLAREKVMIIDGSFHFENSEVFEQLLRMGRKLNIMVILTMQNLEHIDDAGITLFKNFGNHVIMRTESEHQANILKAGIIVSEEDFADASGLKRFIMITPDGKTKVKGF